MKKLDKAPFPKTCQCLAQHTDEAFPLYCFLCSTFTHTVYWLRS